MQQGITNGQAESLSDEQLVLLCREGDDAAFRLLAARFFLTLSKKAVDYSRRGAETDDLVQEGLIALHEAVSGYREDRGASFRTYADVCIRNRMISALRRINARRNRINDEAASIEEADLLPSPPENDPQNAVIIAEELKALQDHLRNSLSQTESAVLRLYFEGMTYEQIAERLGISRKSADNAIQRVRKKIRNRR